MILILLLGLTPNLVRPLETEVTPLEDTPGFLPFKLGTCKIILSNHIFLHYIEISKLEKQIEQLVNISLYTGSILKDASKSLYHTTLKDLFSHVEYLIAEINSKYYNLIPQRRFKRGLFNAVGTLSKWLFGIQDAEDGKILNKAINQLKDKQNNLGDLLNTQIALSQHLINNYNKTLTTLSGNQNIILQYIGNLHKTINDARSDIYWYVSARNTIDQIIMNANAIINFLDNLENAVIFSKLNVLHPDIVSLANFEILLKNLSAIYPQEKIIQLNDIHSYYSFVHTQVHFTDNRIIFAIYFPITHPDLFEYYHIYPIPTRNQTIIIPPKPYLALAQNEHQYQDNKCKLIEETYICHHEEMRSNQNDDCIIELIKDTHRKSCNPVPVIVKNPLIEKIDENYYIIISPEEKRLKTNCKETKHQMLQGSNLLYLPPKCQMEINNLKFGNVESISTGSPFILPPIMATNSTLQLPNQQLIIENISLDEIHQLQQQVKATFHPVENGIRIHENQLLIFVIILITLIVITYISLKMYRYFHRTLQMKTEVETIPEPVAELKMQNSSILEPQDFV